MHRPCLLLFATAIAAAGIVPMTMTAAEWKTPRTPWGDPDLQGVWSTAAELAVPFERPAAQGDRQWLTDTEFEQRLKQVNDPTGAFAGQGTDPPSHWIERGEASRRTSLVIDPPDGRMPAMTAEGRQRLLSGPPPFGNGPFDGPEDTSLWVRCITRGGLPGVMFPTVYNANIRIVQGPGFVAITYEMIHDTRIVPTDGRPHVGAAVRQYFGNSTGRWDGDTLVVDVTNFTGKSSFRGSSDALHLIERFRRIEKDVVRYEVTLDDPRTWTGSWTAALDMRRQAAGLFEYACHEGNYGLLNMLATSRVAEKSKK
jgi:hypothetical protein